MQSQYCLDQGTSKHSIAQLDKNLSKHRDKQQKAEQCMKESVKAMM